MKWPILCTLFLLLASCSNFESSSLSYRLPAALEVRAVDPAAKRIDQVHSASRAEKVVGLAEARVVVADYDLIRRDFPELRQLSHQEIDAWLLQNSAFMSWPQSQQEMANNKIQLSGSERQAYRPPQYGRALVFQADDPSAESEANRALKMIRETGALIDEALTATESNEIKNLAQELRASWRDEMNLVLKGEDKNAVEASLNALSSGPSNGTIGARTDWQQRLRTMRQELIRQEVAPEKHIGLIDAKGVGSLNPSAGGHTDGLATLGETIREYAYEKLVNMIFQNEDQNLRTVGTYAVIDTGFNVKHQDGSESPGGIVLRQAHNRFESHSSLFSEADSVRIENILRKYGLTSAGAYREKYHYDKINVQGTKAGAVLDFGGFLAVERFERDARHFYGQDTLLSNKMGPLVQPDPALRVPLEVWGTTVTGKEDPKLDNIWIWSHELAWAFREGRAGRDAVLNHMRNLLGPMNDKLSASKQSCRELFESLVRYD